MQDTLKGDSSVFVLSRTGHFEYSPVHNSVNINGRNFILHLHGSCHMCVSMCDKKIFCKLFQLADIFITNSVSDGTSNFTNFQVTLLHAIIPLF